MKRLSKHQAREIIRAIDRYIAKAEEDEKDELREIGYLKADDTMRLMDDLEEQLAQAVSNQSERFCRSLANSGSLEEYLESGLREFIENDTIQDEVKVILQEFSGEALEQFTEAYLEDAGLELLPDAGDTDIGDGLAVSPRTSAEAGTAAEAGVTPPGGAGPAQGTAITRRTADAIQEWADDAAQYFAQDTYDQLRKILEDGVKAGKGVDTIAREILQEGIRDTYFNARRVAQTEVLRMQSYATFEAMIQNPDVEEKEWHHTGSHKNQPRPNHVAMDGTRVPKMERFTLHGADGCIYYPMFPRDTCLPASETVNCKCLLRRVKTPKKPYTKERKQQQQAAIEEDNRRWEEERGKTPETSTDGMLEWVKGLDKEQQQEYFGGGYAGRQRWALVESGVIDTDEKFQQLYKTNERGVRSRKSLKELADDGIMTVPRSTLNHSVLGEYKPKSKQWPSGRLISGGHGQAAMEKCDSLKIDYEVTKTLENGVRIGNVPSSKSKRKREQEGQTWFPKDWTGDDILSAGIYVANTAPITDDGYVQTARYKNVVVRVLRDSNGLGSIYPYFDQEE